MPSVPPDYDLNVFINCPYDELYRPLFEAMIFVLYDTGYRPRCALESSDGGEVRVDKIMRIIADCRLSIHDLSRVETDRQSFLPRFNMPLELGIDLGCRKYGTSHLRQKKLLILDTEKFRYQKFISDLSGQDIEAHGNEASELIKLIRNWLRNQPGRWPIPGGTYLVERFDEFSRQLPRLYQILKWDSEHFNYADYSALVLKWLEENPQ